MTATNIKVSTQVGCQYRFFTKKAGKLLPRTDWFFNHLTDLGLDNIGSVAGWRQYCQIGAGNAPPQNSDIGLQSRLAGVNFDGNITGEIEPVGHWLVSTRVATFPAGIMGGPYTVSEVGVGPSATAQTLTSRALVLDVLGNPTSISVLEDEDLIVAWRFWLKQPEGDVFDGTVDGRHVVIRPAFINTQNNSSGSHSPTGWGYFFSNQPLAYVVSPASIQAYSNRTLGPVTGGPTGTGGSSWNVGSNSNWLPYVPGSRERKMVIPISTSQGNDAYGINTLAMVFNGPCFQMSIDPPLTKTPFQTARIGFTLTWDRMSV